MLHKNVPITERHGIHNWEYANAAALTAATGFTPADIGKLALQLDTSTLHVLVDDSPITWSRLSYTAGDSAVNFLTAPATLDTHAATGAQLFGYRNKIINGNFSSWQVGTTQTSHGFGSSDHWKHAVVPATGGVFVRTHERMELPLSFATLPSNPRYYSRNTLVTTTANLAATDYCYMRQNISDVRSLAGKTVTLSFYAKADAVRNMSVGLEQVFGNTTIPIPAAVVKIALTTSWTKYTFTVTLPTLADDLTDIGNYFSGVLHITYTQLFFWFSAGSNFDNRTDTLGVQANDTTAVFDISSVQLEEGSFATPFEKRPVSLELALCKHHVRVQNYYVGSTATNLGTIDMAHFPSITGGGAGFDETGTTKENLIAFQTTPGMQTLTLIADF